MRILPTRNARAVAVAASLLLSPVLVLALVTVPDGVTSLITSPTHLPASSGPRGAFSFALTQTAGETLSSVSVTISNVGASTATGADFSSVLVYKDNGDSTFNVATDLLSGTQTTVNIGSATTVTTSANNAIDGGKFFVALSTGASWSSASSPVDAVSVTLPTNGVVTSASSPTVATTTTDFIIADTVAPQLISAVAKNTGGTSAKEAGDSVELTFSEATSKPVLTAAAISTTFTLSVGHSFLDGLGVVASAGWNAAGTVFTITLSGNVSLPTVEPGDTVTVAGSLITDVAGNVAGGSRVFSGSFSGDVTGPTLTSAVAQNTGGNAGKGAGDSILFIFNEATNKPTITSANVNSALALSSSHSFLDGAGALGGSSWNATGTQLTVTLSAGTLLPTVVVGDAVTVAASIIQDAAGNNASGSVAITGTFGAAAQDDDDDDDDKRQHGRLCDNGLIKGQLYQVTGSPTLYRAAGCRLKQLKKTIIMLSSIEQFTGHHDDDDDEGDEADEHDDDDEDDNEDDDDDHGRGRGRGGKDD